MKYRIKIYELNNGKKYHIPEYFHNNTWNAITKFLESDLIVNGEIIFDGHYENESDALIWIEKHKEREVENYLKEVKQISYKVINL